MRTKSNCIAAYAFLLFPILGFALNTHAQEAVRTLGKVERMDKKLDELLAPDAQLEILA
jgi:hypothetical protein